MTVITQNNGAPIARRRRWMIGALAVLCVVFCASGSAPDGPPAAPLVPTPTPNAIASIPPDNRSVAQEAVQRRLKDQHAREERATRLFGLLAAYQLAAWCLLRLMGWPAELTFYMGAMAVGSLIVWASVRLALPLGIVIGGLIIVLAHAFHTANGFEHLSGRDITPSDPPRPATEPTASRRVLVGVRDVFTRIRRAVARFRGRE